MDEFIDDVFAQLKRRAYQARVVSIGHLPSLQDDILERSRQGLFDSEFYKTRLEWFAFAPPKDFEANSMIVVAVPRPQTRATFTWKGKAVPLILPPTYTAYDEITKSTSDIVSELLKKEGYKTAPTALPLKTLAVRSGLTQYGRNNITYVPGMGSFLQLVAVYSDLNCTDDTWQESTMMKACEKCHRCRDACPTGAISSDRFLLHAERCIVYRNEKPGNVPFPDWMNPSWHNCIIGCMLCQRACPVDRKLLDWVEDEEEFCEAETKLLLEGAKPEGLADTTMRKLRHINLAEDIDKFPRNLGVFCKRDSTMTPSEETLRKD